ncbi:MAG: D-xylose ABC transporter ATP-binding protein [Opitutae bacterium]|nr:D-xylose ABC transporter ATP-binding protein [Opitutae bacterium]|tara:strand:+ start:1199 stop:2710 length:1512 start_codon:yes stop_codon:yes gene_type:complete
MSADSSPLLEVKGLTKSFPGVLALRGVSLHLKKGEVLSLIGENGAGKSTLMKILAGVQPADSGEYLIEGGPVNFQNVRDAMNRGIALIHQELNLASNLDLAANIFLGREPNKKGIIQENEIREDATKYLQRVGLDLPTETITGTLPIGKQQLVEIAKALSCDARVLIMDEPTSSLSQKETETLFEVVKDLRNQGISVIYISHRLGEVIELSDRVTVFRDGENAGDLAKEEINHENMVRLMVGRDLSEFYDRQIHQPGKTVLQAREIISPAYSTIPVSFEVRAGEIVGIAGLVGAGRTELLQTIFGVTPALAGELELDGQSFRPSCPADAINAGIALAPEDRKQHGLVLPMTVRENASLPSLERDQSKGFLNQEAELKISEKAVEQMQIKTPSIEQIARFLSGGNQQKIVLGKWLAMNPKLLMLDEPTRGIDVGAKREIYKLMEKLAGEGMAILFVSSEMEEVLGMADRAYIMHEGKISGELDRNELSEESIMNLATGGEKTAA